MPITPRKGESKDAFMERCMSEVSDADPDRSDEQNVAICSTAWRDAHGGSAPKDFIADRAYSVLNIKRFDEEQRVIEGMATTPSTDRVGDIVEPMGAKFATPFPLLWQHKSDQPVGHVEVAEPTPEGIKFSRAHCEDC